MDAKTFLRILDSDFYTGVPDSQLRALCDELQITYGGDHRHHVIAANEGNAAALAAGYHLATGKVPVVYMQNSGEGNMLNPAASLLNPQVYGIPVIFVVGWRGQPGVKDEPQHIYQGKITRRLLDDLDIPSFVVGPDTLPRQLEDRMKIYRHLLEEGKSVALVVRKGALTVEEKVDYQNSHRRTREEILKQILSFTGEDPVVSTTGKTSREVFELRAQAGQDHSRDFLTVGSMGHSSSIALGIALQTGKRVFCIDGDGAAIMHMGAMSVIGAVKPKNLIHILINNEAHETVGGMPTSGSSTDFCAVALGCGYRSAVRAETEEEVAQALTDAKNQEGPCFLEIPCAIGARENLGRPTTTPQENKLAFMAHLRAE